MCVFVFVFVCVRVRVRVRVRVCVRLCSLSSVCVLFLVSERKIQKALRKEINQSTYIYTIYDICMRGSY